MQSNTQQESQAISEGLNDSGLKGTNDREPAVKFTAYSKKV